MAKKVPTGGAGGMPSQTMADGSSAIEGVSVRIRETRRSLGFTQEELAQRIGVSRSAIAQWETDRTGQVRSNLARVAAVLGVSVSYLLTGENQGADAGVETADERALLTLYRELQDGGRTELLRQGRRILAEQQRSAGRRKS